MDDTSPYRLEDLQPGGQFKQYQLLERIGYGGQAVIWSAFDRDNTRVVAIKLSQLADLVEPDLTLEVQAFERQARIIAALDHPHILPLYDYGAVGRLRFMVMPYITAGSLKELLDTTSLTLRDNLDLVTQIASALDYIHKNKIVHRDLKPTNILVDYSRNIYLADFGLARVLTQTTQPLHTGRGTPPYAPPEQHTASKMTPQSDIYSLGILLYELLTKELPWRGEKSLGIQQLTDTAEALPDPRELNPNIPAKLVDVLRTITAADPDARPKSASATLKLIRESIASDGREGAVQPGDAVQLDSQSASPFMHMALLRNDDACELLRRGMSGWSVEQPGRYPLSLTRFALVDVAYMQKAEPEMPLDADCAQFMLYGALLYGQRPDYWWRQVVDAHQKVSTCASIIEKGDQKALERVVTQLSSDVTVSSWASDLPPATAASLLKAASKLDDPTLIERLLALVRRRVRSASSWQKASFSTMDDMRLAELALTDRLYAVEATRLIGHVRSETAVQVILGEKDPARLIPALITVREVAGSLPSSTSLPIQLRVTGELLFRQLTAEPNALLRTYFMAALGSVLGFSVYVYLIYRLPSFMDATRLLVALERGSFLGAFVGFGVFLTRAIVQRLTSLSLTERLTVGIIIGSLTILFSLFSYDILFLDLLPSGWLIPAGSIVIACGFGLSAGLLKSIWLRMAASGAALILALGLTWLLHLATLMQPVLFYEYGWPTARVLFTVLATALPMAVLGNVGELEATSGKG